MAPIKFEEYIKDKLEKRILSPSSDGWSKLSERLDAEEKSNKRPLYWWIGVAAGLVILLAVTIQFFNNEETESVMPNVVEEKTENTIEQPKETLTEVNKTNEVAVEESEAIKSPTKNEQQIFDNGELTREPSENDARVAENESKPETHNNSKAIEKQKQELTNTTDEDIMKAAVASTLESMKSENTEVTNREVDSLLKLASKELLRDKIIKETLKTVDANTLLRSVEDEMGQSFRSKVFEALKESYETVKTAVAERNN